MNRNSTHIHSDKKHSKQYLTEFRVIPVLSSVKARAFPRFRRKNRRKLATIFFLKKENLGIL